VNKYSVKSVLKVLTCLAEASTLQKSLIKTDLALNKPTSLMMMMMMIMMMTIIIIIIIIIIMLLNFRSIQKRRPVKRRKNHTHKHVEDSFKEHTFKEITSSKQTPIREISVSSRIAKPGYKHAARFAFYST
jgi:predicted membrane protein